MAHHFRIATSKEKTTQRNHTIDRHQQLPHAILCQDWRARPIRSKSFINFNNSIQKSHETSIHNCQGLNNETIFKKHVRQAPCSASSWLDMTGLSTLLSSACVWFGSGTYSGGWWHVGAQLIGVECLINNDTLFCLLCACLSAKRRSWKDMGQNYNSQL